MISPFDEMDFEVLFANVKRQQLFALRRDLTTELTQSRYEVLFGKSKRMAEVRDVVNVAADTDVTVLMHGESGTGQELVARALYASSRRRDKPFLKTNCAALPTELLDSELFGFERGAFTWALP
jgi:transcriptional regulator with GAF, ATPase, and Fis domain